MINIISVIDHRILELLYQARVLPVTQFFLLVSEFGGPATVAKVSVIIVALLALKKRYADIVGLMAAVGGSTVAVVGLKYVINRPRPDAIYQAYIEGPNYSFPSAHAGLSAALYGYLIYLIFQSYPTTVRRVLIVVLAFGILLVGFSRLYLGVHYLSDVLGGFLVGFFFAWVGRLARQYALVWFKR